MKNKLVWSDDPKDQQRMREEEDAKSKFQEDDQTFVDSRSWTAIFRIETKGRGGKTVTVLAGLPKQEAFLRQLCQELKTKCGSGGTYFRDDGRIEIQGDKRVMMKTVLTKRNIAFKGM